MSHGAFACFAYTLTDDAVQKNAPNYYKQLMDSLEGTDDYTIDSFAYEVMVEGLSFESVEDDPDDPLFSPLYYYKMLQDELKLNTGLIVELKFHDEEDPHDEIQGHFWFVDNAVQFTPEAEKVKDDIHLKTYVMYG